MKGQIRPVEAIDRDPLETILLATGAFTTAEINIALELIDVVLHNKNQTDYIVNVYDDETARGYYCIGPTPGTEGTFDLYWIAVDPSVQGRGVGVALNDHAEQVIRSLGGRLIIVETSSTARYDRTRKFYDGRGYSQTARLVDYYRPGDDLIVYTKYLH